MENKFEIRSLVRANVAGMAAYSSARDEFSSEGEGLVFLDANENPFENGLNRYPDPQQQALKRELASLKGVDPRQILLGNGSDEVLDLLFRAFCEPGVDNILTLAPTYGMYKVLARLNNIEERELLLDEGFQPIVEKVLSAADDRSKILFLCSPNNPTGNSFSEESVEALLKGFPGLVVIDEAYIDFSAKQSWLRRLEAFPNLVIVQTFSKAYGLAGIRLGIAYASEELIALLNKIKPPYNINILTQQAALKALGQQDILRRQIEQLLAQRSFLEQSLKEIGFVSRVYPSDANFILAEVDDARKRYLSLLECGIVVRDRSNQPGCKNCLRFTVGTQEENAKLVTTIKELEKN